MEAGPGHEPQIDVSVTRLVMVGTGKGIRVIYSDALGLAGAGVNSNITELLD
jgi:hypothetical protein